jgi:chromosome partitioning protein
MKTILVVNAKGGCGKTTLSTNLASYFATNEFKTVLVDFDPQKSSLEWLKERNEEYYYEIQGVSPFGQRLRFAADVDRVILDAPARVDGKQLTNLVRRADMILVPVLPSPIDMRAAAHFIKDLLMTGHIDEKKIAVIANRIRENTLIYHQLEKFLKHLKIPFLASIRDSQNYIHAAEHGLGIFDMPWHQVSQDIEQWQPLIRWINRNLK